jgi:hypothetical protein
MSILPIWWTSSGPLWWTCFYPSISKWPPKCTLNTSSYSFDQSQSSLLNHIFYLFMVYILMSYDATLMTFGHVTCHMHFWQKNWKICIFGLRSKLKSCIVLFWKKFVGIDMTLKYFHKITKLLLHGFLCDMDFVYPWRFALCDIIIATSQVYKVLCHTETMWHMYNDWIT